MEEQVNETIEMYLSLEKEKGKVEAILASMVEGVLVCDEQGAVTLVNEKARLALSRDGATWLPEHGMVLGLLQRAALEHTGILRDHRPGHRRATGSTACGSPRCAPAPGSSSARLRCSRTPPS